MHLEISRLETLSRHHRQARGSESPATPSRGKHQQGPILQDSRFTLLYFTVTLDPYPFLGLLGLLIRQLKV